MENTVISAIGEDTELAKAFEEYSKHLGAMNVLKNEISVAKAKLEKLQANEKFLEAKAEIDLRTRMNGGKLVCGAFKASLVNQPEKVIKAFSYVLISRGKS